MTTRAIAGVDCCEDCGWTDYWPVCPSCKADRERADAQRRAFLEALFGFAFED